MRDDTKGGKRPWRVLATAVIGVALVAAGALALRPGASTGPAPRPAPRIGCDAAFRSQILAVRADPGRAGADVSGSLQPPPAACLGSVLRAIAVLDPLRIVGVGVNTGGEEGALVLFRSADGGVTWTIEGPDAPGFVSLAKAGDRLYGSVTCLPKYPPEASEPSGVDVMYGSGVDHSFHPAAASCLYYSDDAGLTWHDAGTGHVVGPSFAGDLDGLAQGPEDVLAGVPTALYSTIDGGRSWQPEASPCDAGHPLIKQVAAAGRRAGLVLCESVPIVASEGDRYPWELFRISPDAAPERVLAQGVGDVLPNAIVSGYWGNLTVGAGGSGWIYTYGQDGGTTPDGLPTYTETIFRTTDGGRSWVGEVADPNAIVVRSASFVDAKVGFGVEAAYDHSSILRSDDGGRTWRILAAWDWPLNPRPLPS